jgi:ribosomal protein S18 acetylase RimI-like enzyme
MQARVLHTSKAALSFYRSHGFAEVGTELTELPGNVMVPTAIMEVAVEALAMASRSDV